MTKLVERWLYLDGVIGVGDECDEKAEDHVDKEWHEGVEVDSAEHPHQAVLLLHVLKSGKHVVSIDQREQTLWHSVQRPELQRHLQSTTLFFFTALIKKK